MPEKARPFLRGHFHQAGFFVALGAGGVLIATTHGLFAQLVCLVYILSLCGMFAISGLYHRISWRPETRLWWRRLDHSAIYLLIAGTETPICLLGMKGEPGLHLLWISWGMAVAGILKELLWVKAPKCISAMFYVIMGWAGAPYLNEMIQALGFSNIALIVTGGVIYTLGAVIYATKKPNLFPAVFGYHEAFHLLVIVAALLHFIVVYQLVVSA